MPHSNAMIGVVEAIEATDFSPSGIPIDTTPAPGTLRLRFSDGREVYVDRRDPDAPAKTALADILRSMKRPVYVTLSAPEVVEDVSAPHVARVTSLRGLADGSLHVGLDTCSRRLVLRPEAHDYSRLARLLRTSRVDGSLLMVTDDSTTQEIRDVDEALPTVFEFAPALDRAARFTFSDLERISVVDQKTVARLFRDMTETTCEQAGQDDCIPFTYPDNGCFARAHQMCKLLRRQKIVAGKVWVFGRLNVVTDNHPRCAIAFEWHVAPFVKLRGAGQKAVRVLDPAFFERAEPLSTFLERLGDPDARPLFTSASVFLRSKDGAGRPENVKQGVRPGSTETEDFLSIYRRELAKRKPPPPYDCRL